MTRLIEIDFYKIKKIVGYHQKERKPPIHCFTIIYSDDSEKYVSLNDEDHNIFRSEYNKIK